MKKHFRQILVFAMLVMGIEGAADMANDGHPINGNGSHHGEVMHESPSEPGADSEPDNENCEHCCHGHSASLTVRTIANSFTFAHKAISNRIGQSFIAQPQAPPTPPPKTTV